MKWESSTAMYPRFSLKHQHSPGNSDLEFLWKKRYTESKTGFQYLDHNSWRIVMVVDGDVPELLQPSVALVCLTASCGDNCSAGAFQCVINLSSLISIIVVDHLTDECLEMRVVDLNVGVLHFQLLNQCVVVLLEFDAELVVELSRQLGTQLKIRRLGWENEMLSLSRNLYYYEHEKY